MNAQGKITGNLTAETTGKITTVTSREFNQHTGAAKTAADNGPVVITDRGKPAYVLLSHAEYEQLANKGQFISIAEALADTGPDGDFPFEFERARCLARDIDLGED